MEPDTFTITTFWLDWLLMPFMLALAWLTIRWAISDLKLASDSASDSNTILPSWVFSTPLFVSAVAWILAGFGTLIKEDYWEMRVIFVAFLLWTLCCILGAIVLFFSRLKKDKAFDFVVNCTMIGLVIISLLMIIPCLIDRFSPSNIILIGHIWFLLLAVSVGLLLTGILLGFPYKFPRFPLGLGILFLIGWGLSEIAFSQASFPWLIRIWRPNLELEYLNAFPISTGWKIAGTIKLLMGIATIAILVIISRRQKILK